VQGESDSTDETSAGQFNIFGAVEENAVMRFLRSLTIVRILRIAPRVGTMRSFAAGQPTEKSPVENQPRISTERTQEMQKTVEPEINRSTPFVAVIET
jgi:hypothetical protein